MTKKELMIKAHKMVKEIKAEYPAVDYKFQLGLCLAYLYKEGENEMVELKGTEKQVAWAESIRENVVKSLEIAIAEYKEDRATRENEGRKFPKRFIRYTTALENLLEEVKNNDSSKYFIEEYRAFSNCSDETIKNYFAIGNGNVEF